MGIGDDVDDVGLYSGTNEAMACPPTRGLRLTSSSCCSRPLQEGMTWVERGRVVRRYHEQQRHAMLQFEDTVKHNSLGAAEVLLKHKADVECRDKVGDAWLRGRGACAVDLPLTCAPTIMA